MNVVVYRCGCMATSFCQCIRKYTISCARYATPDPSLQYTTEQEQDVVGRRTKSVRTRRCTVYIRYAYSYVVLSLIPDGNMPARRSCLAQYVTCLVEGRQGTQKALLARRVRVGLRRNVSMHSVPGTRYQVQVSANCGLSADRKRGVVAVARSARQHEMLPAAFPRSRPGSQHRERSQPGC